MQEASPCSCYIGRSRFMIFVYFCECIYNLNYWLVAHSLELEAVRRISNADFTQTYAVSRLGASEIGSCAQSISFAWNRRVFSSLAGSRAHATGPTKPTTATTIYVEHWTPSKHFQTQHASKWYMRHHTAVRSRRVFAKPRARAPLQIKKEYMVCSMFVHTLAYCLLFLFSARSHPSIQQKRTTKAQN